MAIKTFHHQTLYNLLTFNFAKNYFLLKHIFLLLLLSCPLLSVAQTDSALISSTADSIRKSRKPPVQTIHRDSGIIIAGDSLTSSQKDSLSRDSLLQATHQSLSILEDTSSYKAYMQHPFLPFDKEPLFLITRYRNSNGKEELFYLLVFVVFFVATIKVAFPKYIQNIFRLFFQTAFRQKQTRDQLSQNHIASLLLNFLFVLTGGIFIALLVNQYQWITAGFWWVCLYSIGLLTAIYLGKYAFLRLSGWVFNAQEATNTYVFIVFLVNKILGITLIPFLLILAFSATMIAEVAITIALVILGGMLLYRYVAGMGTIRRSLKVNALHFFLYLCAVEVLPLLLIFKALFNFAGKGF